MGYESFSYRDRQIETLQAENETLRERVAQLEKQLVRDLEVPNVFDLTPNQIKLFRLLMSRNTVTFDAAIMVFWGEDSEGGPTRPRDVIRQQLYRVRQKLRKFVGVDVTTIHNHGYRLTDVAKQAAREWIERELSGRGGWA